MCTKVCALLLLALLPCGVAADTSVKQLGYLFTSPAQRETLNTVRDQYQRGLYKEDGQGDVQAGYKFNGVISKGQKTQRIWVNGGGESAAQAKPAKQGHYRLDLPPGRVHIKPGQIYQPASGQVVESYDGGAK